MWERETEKKNEGGGETWNTKKKMESTSLGICSGNEHGLTKKEMNTRELCQAGDSAHNHPELPSTSNANPNPMLPSLSPLPLQESC